MAKKPAKKSVPAIVEPMDTDVSTDFLSNLKIGGNLKVKGTRAVTRPVLRQVDGVGYAVQIISPIREGKRLKTTGETAQKPANVMTVINLETGEEMTMIANAALQSALETEFPDESYVKRYFAIMSQKRQHKEGRQIREYMIKELVVE